MFKGPIITVPDCAGLDCVRLDSLGLDCEGPDCICICCLHRYPVSAGGWVKAAVYQELLTYSDDKYIFQRIHLSVDLPPAHTTRMTQQLLEEFWTLVDQPPCSQDLNSLDFSVCSILQAKVLVKSHANLRQSIVYGIGPASGGVHPEDLPLIL
jgi:hypothetical protein